MRLIALVILTLCAAGCARNRDSAGNDAAPAPARTATPKALAPDAGDFKLHFVPRKSLRRGGSAGHEVGGNREALERVIAELNEKVALPFDVGST